MPATPARIGFITQPYRLATAGPDTSVAALYGNKARDTKEPVETFFDDQTDADAMAEERLALLSEQRSLVTVSIDSAAVGAGLDVSQVLPTVRVIDDEQDRNSSALIVGVGVDMNTGRTTLETWG